MKSLFILGKTHTCVLLNLPMSYGDKVCVFTHSCSLEFGNFYVHSHLLKDCTNHTKLVQTRESHHQDNGHIEVIVMSNVGF